MCENTSDIFRNTSDVSAGRSELFADTSGVFRYACLAQIFFGGFSQQVFVKVFHPSRLFPKIPFACCISSLVPSVAAGVPAAASRAHGRVPIRKTRARCALPESLATFAHEKHTRMKEIFQFLRDLAANNDRGWFRENRSRYDDVAAKLQLLAADMIGRVSTFEPAASTLEPAQTLYRIYRDTRFSQDKTPYKTWMGIYVNPRGKKSMHGGYYLHLEPGSAMVAGGCWWLEPMVLRRVREDITIRLDEFRAIVEKPAFRRDFPYIGTEHLKTMPKDFPKDFPFPEYLRPKNYVVGHDLPDSFFLKKGWQDEVTRLFRDMQPFVDFINETVDDYI